MSGAVPSMDEYLILAIYRAGTRAASAARIRDALPYVSDDPGMEALLRRTLGKLSAMTEAEYRKLDLEVYVQDTIDETEEPAAEIAAVPGGGRERPD